MGFKNLIRHKATLPATPHRGLEAYRHKDLPRFEGHCAGCSGGREVGYRQCVVSRGRGHSSHSTTFARSVEKKCSLGV